MQYKLFAEMRLSRVARVPRHYAREVRWQPQIRHVVPDFKAETTTGPLSFYDWAGESWVFLFSHPAAFTPVCSTEMMSLASRFGDFEARDVKLLGVCGSPIDEQRHWHRDMSKSLGAAISFPMIVDDGGMLAELFGMMHREESCEYAIRKSLLIGPDKRIRIISESPILVGRNTDDVLRQVDAVQAVETYNVGIPADWTKGEPCILLPSEYGEPRFDYWRWLRIVRSYLKFVDPWHVTPTSGSSGAEQDDVSLSGAPICERTAVE